MVVTFIAIILTTLWFLVITLLNDEISEKTKWEGFFIGIIILVVSLSVVSMSAYRDGQIDALSGKNIKYKLEIQPDSSRVWVRR